MRRGKPASLQGEGGRITGKQVKMIHALKSKRMSEENYRALLSGFGAESCKTLSVEEAKRVIEALMRIRPTSSQAFTHAPALAPKMPSEQKRDGTGPVSTRTGYYGKGRRGSQQILTQMQAERIEILERLLKWDRARTTAFIRKQTGKLTAVSMLMNYEAVKVIVGMTKVITNYELRINTSPQPQRRGKPASLQGEGGKSERYRLINRMNNEELGQLSITN